MLNRVTDQPNIEQLPAEHEFDLRDWINFSWRQWRLIAGVTVLGLAIGALYLARAIPVYTATTQVLLDPRKERPVGKGDDISSDVPLDMAAIESEMAVIRSTVLLTRVVEKSNLVNDPEFGAGPAGDGWSLLNAVKSVFNRDGALPAEVKQQLSIPSQVSATVENLKGALNVLRTGQALLLNISFTSADPGKAARLSNAIADAYLVDKLDARFEAATRASGWLSDRLEELRKKLRQSEEAEAQFRAAHNLVQTGSASTLTQEQLGQLNSRLVAARADTAEKKAKVNLLDTIEKNGSSILSLPDVANSGTISQSREQDSALSAQEADLLARYNERYPAVVNIRAQRRDIQRTIANETSRIAANIRNDYALAKARQDAVENTLQQVTGQNDLDANAAITLRELERTAAVNKTLFEEFLQRARITEEQSTFEARDARIITPALPPGTPSAPIRSLVIAISGSAGLGVGILVAYLAEVLNAGFKTPRELETLLELPLLGSISKMQARDLDVDGKAIAMPLYPMVKPLSRFSEALRTIRSGVRMADVDEPPRVLEVTSTILGEGKTTIALALATSEAQSGIRVLFVDGDLRHPSASKFFGRHNEKGLVDYLASQAELDEVLRYEEKAGYWVIPAGGKTQNPPDLLGSARLKNLVAQLREMYDLIIFDTPPLGPVVDPVILSNLVDKVVFVVRWGSTAREMVQRGIQQIPGHRKVAGVVFNLVDDAEAQKYGKYAAAYYYGTRYYKKYYNE
jgi:succinoglycan biosynthesis transport protein ExoP